MNSKKMNIVMLVASILFCLIFGVACFLRAENIKRLDSEHDKQVEQNESEANKNLLNDVSTTQKNDVNKDSTSNNTGTVFDSVTNEKVDFLNFVSIYNYAEHNLNNSINSYSKATGTATVSGNVNFGGYKINNAPLQLEFVKTKNSTRKWLGFEAYGPLMENVDFACLTEVYSEGALSYIYNDETDKWSNISNDAVQQKFGCDVNQTFQIITKDSVKSSIVTLDKGTLTYTAEAELDTSKSSARASRFIHGALNADNDANYKSCHLTVTIDANGNFKSIRYLETFNIKLSTTANNLNMSIDATIIADYTEVFYSGEPEIHRPKDLKI